MSGIIQHFTANGWEMTSAENYWHMLGALPPAFRGKAGSFLVGEPMSHTAEGLPTFTGFANIGDTYLERIAPATRRQFQAEIAALLSEAATEPTPIGLQYVIPGCEKDRSRNPKPQLDLF